MLIISLLSGVGSPFVAYFLAFLICDLTLASLACWIEKESLRRAAWIIPMRFVYRPILSYVVWRSILHMLRGVWVGWGKLDRKGTVANASVEILKTIRLFLAAALLATGCREQLADPAPEPSASPKAPLHLVIPKQGAYTGAYIDFGESEDDVTLEQIEGFEEAVGKRQAIVASSSYWGEQSFPLHNLEIITRHNAIPLIYWSPWDKPYVMERGPDRFSLDAIVAGKWDAYIDSWARQAKAFERPIFVAWGLEMNGNWFPWSGYFYGGGKQLSKDVYAGPDLYKRAYRYIVDRVRAIGAKNIIWVFHVQNYSYPSDEWNQLAGILPRRRLRRLARHERLWETIPRRAMGLRLRYNDLCLRRSLWTQFR